LLKRRDHTLRIEAAIREIDIGVDAKVQLSALLRRRCIDSCLNQALEVVLTLIRIDDVNSLMPTLESVFNEREQNPILFVWAVEECADMARLVDLGTSKRNRSRGLLHDVSPKRYRTTSSFKSRSTGMHSSALKCVPHQEPPRRIKDNRKIMFKQLDDGIGDTLYRSTSSHRLD